MPRKTKQFSTVSLCGTVTSEGRMGTFESHTALL